MSKEIDTALNLPPIVDVRDDIQQSKPIVKVERTEVDNDFDFARENLYNVINRGADAIEDMIDLARASQHPRSYEVLATLMKTTAEANKDLLDLQKKKKDIKQADEKESPQTVNNNLFVGSTADLQKMLKGE